MNDESTTQKGQPDADQPMKSSLLDDEDEVQMSGVTSTQERMVDPDEARDYEATQIKQRSAG